MQILFPGPPPEVLPGDPQQRPFLGYLVTLDDGVSVSSLIVNNVADTTVTFGNLNPDTSYTASFIAIVMTPGGNQQAVPLGIPTLTIRTEGTNLPNTGSLLSYVFFFLLQREYRN